MMKSFTKKALLGAVLMLSFATTFAAGKMKDIELDPGKNVNVGNQMWFAASLVSTTIVVDFFFEQEGAVTAYLFDMNGNEAAESISGVVGASRTNECDWDATNIPQGIYFARLVHENGTVMTKKFVVMH
jgi:hypothetical protein